MTTYTIYPSSDHKVDSSGASYAIRRAGSGTLTYSTTDAEEAIGYENPSFFRQAFFAFNTSGAGAQTPGEQVKFTFVSSLVDGSPTAKLGESSWSGGTGDFIAGASLTGLPLFGSVSPIVGTNVITKSSSVTRTSAYKLIMWGTQQESATDPAAHKRFAVYLSERSGTTDDPRLTITIPPIGTLSASIGEFGVSSTAGAKASATGGGSIGEITSASTGVNLARGTLAATVGDITSTSAASMLVPVNTSQDRRFNFDASTLADRTFSLNA